MLDAVGGQARARQIKRRDVRPDHPDRRRRRLHKQRVRRATGKRLQAHSAATRVQIEHPGTAERA